MGLSCRGPLTCGFSLINATVLHDPRLAEPKDAEPLMMGAGCKVMLGFSAAGRVGAPQPPLFKYMMLCSNNGNSDISNWV